MKTFLFILAIIAAFIAGMDYGILIERQPGEDPEPILIKKLPNYQEMGEAYTNRIFDHEEFSEPPTETISEEEERLRAMEKRLSLIVGMFQESLLSQASLLKEVRRHHEVVFPNTFNPDDWVTTGPSKAVTE